MAASFIHCSFWATTLAFIVMIFNLGLFGLSGYIFYAHVQAWNTEKPLANHTEFVMDRIKFFQRDCKDIIIWTGICTSVYLITIIWTLLFISKRKKNPLFLAVFWMTLSVISICTAVGVTTLYILSYFGIMTENKLPDGDGINHLVEIGPVIAAVFIYSILYICLLAIVGKEFCGRPKQKRELEGIEEVGTPDGLDGYEMYTGKTHKGGSTSYDRNRGVENMYSRPIPNPRNSLKKTENRLYDDEEVYVNVERNSRTQQSTYKPERAAKTSSNYQVQPYIDENATADRHKRYSQYKDQDISTPLHTDPRCSLNTYNNDAFDSQEFYQIPRIQQR